MGTGLTSKLHLEIMIFFRVLKGSRKTSSVAPHFSSRSMVVAPVVVHPRGLHPMEALRAWHLHREEGLPLTEVQAEVPGRGHFERGHSRVSVGNSGGIRREFNGNSSRKKGIQHSRGSESSENVRASATEDVPSCPRVLLL